MFTAEPILNRKKVYGLFVARPRDCPVETISVCVVNFVAAAAAAAIRVELISSLSAFRFAIEQLMLIE